MLIPKTCLGVLMMFYSCNIVQIGIYLMPQLAYFIADCLLFESKCIYFFHRSSRICPAKYFFLFFVFISPYFTELIVLLSHHVQYVPKWTYFPFWTTLFSLPVSVNGASIFLFFHVWNFVIFFHWLVSLILLLTFLPTFETASLFSHVFDTIWCITCLS